VESCVTSARQQIAVCVSMSPRVHGIQVLVIASLVGEAHAAISRTSLPVSSV